MCSLEICPECDELVSFNSYFGGYLCNCGWEDRSFFKKREENNSK